MECLFEENRKVMLMLSKEETAEILLNIGAVSLNPVNPFKYASGLLSPIYTDSRMLISFPKERKAIIDSFVDYIDSSIGGENIDIIVGVGHSGISLATWVGERLKIPIAYTRSAAKDHGKGKNIEGILKTGCKALLVSDIMSTETDIQTAVNAINENKCEIVGCLAIFSNQLGIVENFLNEKNIKFYCLTDSETLLSVALAKKKINPEERNSIKEWKKDPENWDKIRRERIEEFLIENKERTAKSLLKIGAVTLNTKTPYRFVSGLLSPIYTDCRLLMSYPKEWEEVIDSMVNIIINEIGIQNINVIAGTATAGISHAAYIAKKLNLPMVYVKSKPEEYGKQNKIEGIIKNGDKVLLIEDLISTGGSSISSANAIREVGGIIENCLAIFTYGMEIAQKSFEQEGIKTITLTDFNTLVDAAVKQNYIRPEEKNMVLEWSKDSASWGKKMGFE
jgi:orotate phosphoribosyltransferase